MEYRFPQGKFKRHEPYRIVPKHCNIVSITWPYSNQRFDYDLIHQNLESKTYFRKRMKNKEAIVFNNLTTDEKRIKIEQNIEAQRIRKEEKKAREAI